MAGNSVIGALRVDLGLNSAQFTEGVKKAQVSLAAFGKAAAVGLAAVSAAAIAAGAALGVAVKGAIDHADALSKAAQKAGVTVEALSRLEYAAKFSEVGLDQLTVTLGKLSKNMADAATNSQGPVATAFRALGIAVKDSSGHLRDADQVFTEIADKLSKLPDGATKTALAIQLFGKAGAQLIPVLNEGRAGLKAFADESDRIGVTISTKTAEAANKFNDTLTKIGSEFEGIANIVAADLLPILQQIADWFTSPQVVGAIDSFFKSVTHDFQEFVETANQLAAAIAGIGNAANAVGDLLSPNGGKSSVAPYSWADYLNASRDAGDQLRLGMGSGQKYGASGSSLYSGFGFGSNGQMSLAGGGAKNGKPSISLPTFDTAAAKSSLNVFDIALVNTRKKTDDLIKAVGDGLTGAVQDFADAILQGTDPLKAFADQLANIGQQLLNAGIQSIIGSIFKPSPLAFVPGTGFAQLQPHADGGPVSLGSPYLVGERGPEMFVPGQSGMIVPNHALGGGGSTVIQVQLDPGLVGGILKQAGEQSVQIVKKNAPASVARANIDNRRGGG